MDTTQWQRTKDTDEMSVLMPGCGFAPRPCVYLQSSRQESVYLSLQSNLVTLQVLSASPLLQEFIPHLLHLSSRVQTLSSPVPHSLMTFFFKSDVEFQLATGAAGALSESRCETKDLLML